jgi:hypothetical protein
VSAEEYFLQDDSDEGLLFPMSEGNWHSYLAAIDAETGRFFKLFIEYRHVANHLEGILDAMQWKKIVFKNEGFYGEEDVEIVTFHKNPLNIASKAIFFFIEKIWDIYTAECKTLTADACWRFAKLMNKMQNEMHSGVASLDSCEFSLGICHFKNVMSTVNEVISVAKKLPCDSDKCRMFATDFMIALFDIRELAWQSILLCSISEENLGDDFYS